jgi:hypothetical protein
MYFIHTMSLGSSVFRHVISYVFLSERGVSRHAFVCRYDILAARSLLTTALDNYVELSTLLCDITKEMSHNAETSMKAVKSELWMSVSYSLQYRFSCDPLEMSHVTLVTV